MNKKNYTYSIHPQIEQELDNKAHELKRSKSSIVQEAIQKWLKRNERTD